MLDKFRQDIYHQHDVICNQKYGDDLPYSFHLNCVENQVVKFKHLVPEGYVENPQNSRSLAMSRISIVRAIAISHDVIEDGRLTYNDLILKLGVFGNHVAATIIAEAVFCLTDEKGKSREERKNEKYYNELGKNRLALTVKLCDMAANRLYSKMTNSSMHTKYKNEFKTFKERLYKTELDGLFTYVDSI